MCTPDDVFRVLANAWLYPSWVVGASRMRKVDANWPEPGAKLYHSVGAWPFLLDDSTSCIEWQPPHRMVFTVRGWPIGEAHAEVRVTERSYGCSVEMFEHPKRGPARFIPNWITDLSLRIRNRESLNRLAFLADGIADNMRRGQPSEAQTDAPAHAGHTDT